MSKEKNNVRKMVARAVKSGRVKRPDHCEHCGLRVPRDKPHELQAHHEDYSRPLDVEWLCYGCHCYRDILRLAKWVLGNTQGSAHDPNLAFHRRQLRMASQELKKREWMNGIPEKYKS